MAKRIIIEDAPKKKPSQKRPFRCLNSDCQTETNLIHAQDFVRRHYGVLSYPKKKRVCAACYAEAKKQQDNLVEVLEAKRLLLAETLPAPKTTVILTDSGSDPSEDELKSDESEYEVECDDGKSLEETLDAIFTDLGLNGQITDGMSHLEQRSEKLLDEFEKLNTEEFAPLEKELDKIRKEFYDSFRHEIVWQPSLDIGPSGTVIHQPDGTSEVIAEDSVQGPVDFLPPVGPLDRYELQPQEFCYSMKYSLFARWVQAQVIEVEKREPKNTLYKIRYNRTKGGGLPRVIPGRQLAYAGKCPTRIPVGTRVIAKYKDEDPKNSTISGSFYVGIVAEIPTAANKYRYLIFFDDGYAQYVHHDDIRVVTEASTCPWDDVSSDSREFIKEYLQMYPERPMVRLQKGNFVKTEWNGRWWRAQVQEVDGSLVQMFFPVDGRCEWIYRGSTRLSPLFNKKLNIKAQTEQLRTIRRRTAPMPGSAVVEYGTFGQGQDLEPAQQGGERRAVARKSTMTRAGTPPKEVQLRIEQESKGFLNEVIVLLAFSSKNSFAPTVITKKHPLQEKIMKYRRHICASRCLGKNGDSMKKHKDFSPLLYPLLQGWNRLIVKQKRKTNTKHEVFYVAPCGVRLRNISEVFHYIITTESSLEIDCFSFELGVHVSLEWEPYKRIYYSEDMTKAEENVKISCVNSLDESEPLPLTYCNVRLPTKHVPLNLDQDFLVCCDCTDNCQDKSKCACQQLTVHGTRILNMKENPNAGYQHRRLYEQVQSGIYECNSRCHCAVNRCLNRVVQHPLRLKLQLFKTARRGWGVRTLCDVPRGGFICVYVGKMLSETVANEEGKQIIGGDDYYAELDYIEVMESMKEGYEEEVVSPEDSSKSAFQKSSTPGSLGNDSDGFYSENEPDNSDTDRDFPGQLSKGDKNLGKRERSARLQERSKSTNSSKGANSEDENSRSAKDQQSGEGNGKSEKSKEHGSDEDEEAEEAADEKQRQRQAFLPSMEKRERKSVREFFGKDESVYIMDAKTTGNIGRYLNHSCEPNVFVQNVFVDTHDLRFPWVSFFAIRNIRAGCELTWDYQFRSVDSVPGKVKYCYCGEKKCRGRLL
ncbi:LOW QUALITY PROTEIN: histone-lysine N-methyltransferase SETDB1-like [Macrobrachium nipponense]|uniref:LOW QUALITY PROTEIN: histone-lysine N-methyltransferase SETDB1-like n=1 Tax=Macrobrachium nipponense TaxID=159736 RepID=UPI0030C89B5A